MRDQGSVKVSCSVVGKWLSEVCLAGMCRAVLVHLLLRARGGLWFFRVMARKIYTRTESWS